MPDYINVTDLLTAEERDVFAEEDAAIEDLYESCMEASESKHEDDQKYPEDIGYRGTIIINAETTAHDLVSYADVVINRIYDYHHEDDADDGPNPQILDCFTQGVRCGA